MKKMMSACLAMAVGTGVALAAGDGGKDYRPYPHVFVGVDGERRCRSPIMILGSSSRRMWECRSVLSLLPCWERGCT